MRGLVCGFSFAIGLLGLIGTAQAVPVSFSDTHTAPGSPGVFLDGTTTSYFYSHDITGAASGSFNPATDTLTSAEISFSFQDDDDAPAEMARIFLDGTDLAGNLSATNTVHTFNSASVALLITLLQTDGILNVEIRRQNGDFYFVGSTLIAQGTRLDGTTAPVPEPAPLALLALGLLGLGVLRWRQSA